MRGGGAVNATGGNDAVEEGGDEDLAIGDDGYYVFVGAWKERGGLLVVGSGLWGNSWLMLSKLVLLDVCKCC